MVDGMVQTRTFADMADFVAFLPSLTPAQALGYGICGHDEARVVTKQTLNLIDVQNEPEKTPVVARSSSCFFWPEGPALLMLDYDPPKGKEPLSRDGLLQLIYGVCPEIESAPHAVAESASSHIYNGNDCLKGAGGLRVWVAVADGRDIPRAGDALFKRLWLSGHGHIQISKAGSLLVRGLLDQAVWQPERLDFACGAACEAPLEQRRPSPQAFNFEAAPLESHKAIPDLSNAEDRRYKVLVRDAKAELESEAANIREARAQERAEHGAVKSKLKGEGRKQFKERLLTVYRGAFNGGQLHDDFVLYPENGEPVSVAEVLANPIKWNEERFADPLEPDYCNDSRIAYLDTTGEPPYIYTHAHGGRRFTLVATESGKADTEWGRAKELFPRVKFPWHVLPKELEASFKQLARSCAGSATPLPGVAFCLMSAVLGRRVQVAPKQSWKEPLVFWMLDIRESGDGKTAPMWKLARPLRERQKFAHQFYDEELLTWKTLSPKEKAKTPEPKPPRAYFATDYTLEGLHSELNGHPTGGIALLLNEASALISAQNQYKGKGADREAFLCLYDGKETRVTRAGKSILIHGARVQICGGIQPSIFNAAFTAENGTYLEDGTLFRCLMTSEPSTHYALTNESWSAEHMNMWYSTLNHAIAWADEAKDTHTIAFNEEARLHFIDWRNGLDSQKQEAPRILRGFFPKAYAYAARLAGVLHCIRRFYERLEPSDEIGVDELKDGIAVVSFYMGQAVSAAALLEDKDAPPPVEVSERTERLADVLWQLRFDVENGRLAIGFIQEHYNKLATPEEQVTSRAMGALLRASGLTVSPSKHHANGKSGVRCLEWDSRVQPLLETKSPISALPQSQEPCRFRAEDF